MVRTRYSLDVVRAAAARLDAYEARVVAEAERLRTIPIFDYVEHEVPSDLVREVERLRNPERRATLMREAQDVEAQAKKREALAAMLASREGAQEDAGMKQIAEAKALRAKADQIRADANVKI